MPDDNPIPPIITNPYTRLYANTSEPAKDVGEQTGGVDEETASKIDIETGELTDTTIVRETDEGALKTEGSEVLTQTDILSNVPAAKSGHSRASQIFMNLPVKNLNSSIEFFSKLGFAFEPKFTDINATCMIIGENIFAMLLVPDFFRTFTTKEIADASKSTEVLISMRVNSREEVDAYVKKAIEAGGKIYEEPRDDGWMYGWSFADLDGHQWELFYMDESRMPPAPIEPFDQQTPPPPSRPEPPEPEDVLSFANKATY